MTDANTAATPSTDASAGPCLSGSKTDRPCYRRATHKAFDEAEPMRCEEHQRVFDAALTMDGYFYAAEKVAAVLGSPDVEEDPFGELRELAGEWHGRAIDLASKAAHEMKVAELIADARPPMPGDPLTHEEREQKARSIVTDTALGKAWSALADGRPLGTIDHYTSLAALEEARASKT
jgi:hypothetical protein